MKQELGVTEEDLEELGSKEATMYRAMVARGNYLAQDRSDVQVAIKELSRGMSCPHASKHGRAYSGLGMLGVDLHGALIVLINYKNSNVICIITNACAGSLDKSCMRLSEKCVMQKNV